MLSDAGREDRRGGEKLVTIPRFELVPGILTMIEGWLKECVKVVTVIAELADAMLLTWARSHVPASVP